jgi:hypothetical protein
MTAQAQPPALVDHQFRGIGRVLKRGTVAVLALNVHMRRLRDTFKLVGVTVLAVLSALVFDRDLFPVLDIAGPVPAVHITVLMGTEVLRNIEKPEYQDKNN